MAFMSEPGSASEHLPTGRHFLGWEAPALSRAVAWLRPYAQQQEWDLSSLLIAVPAARAGRRLMELLVTAAGGALPGPPTIVTLGRLPDELFEPETPIADELHARLARTLALRQAPAEQREPLLPNPPAEDDWPGWWTLSGQLHELATDLAAHRLTPGHVPAAAERAGIELPQPERWEALASLEKAYHDTLAAAGLCDPQAARLRALEKNQCRCDRHLVLLATVDLNPLLSAMVSRLGPAVTSLVHAPAEHADGFDALGGLVTRYWQNQRVPIEERQLRFVDRPADQARAVVAALDQLETDEGGEPAYAVDQISVGLGDEGLAPTVARSLGRVSVPARYGAGTSLGRSRPALLLAALGRFADGRRFDDLAELLRHPDIEAYLAREERQAGEDGDRAAAAASAHWLTLLDDFARQFLQAQVDGQWLGSGDQQARLKRAWEAITALLPAETAQSRPLPAWSEPIAASLRRVYGPWPLAPDEPADDQLHRALEALAQTLRQQAELPADAELTPRVTFSQAVTLTLSRLSQTSLPEPGGRPAVELMGFLDLPLDDAPVAAVTSLNEGAVPAAVTSDPLLPGHVRTGLGMADSGRRYARDLLRLRSILASREVVTLIAGRRSGEDDPLSPSRLLLACEDEALLPRLKRFFEPGEGEANPPALLEPGGAGGFHVPPPSEKAPVLEGLHVTAFRDYLTCPYRFYLKHVRRLDELDDGLTELDGAGFGELLHEVLNVFGESEWTGCDDPQMLADYLSEQLDKLAGRRFDKDLSHAAVLIQLEQLRQRLRDFAVAQAELAAAGWQVCFAEKKLEASLMVDETPFTIRGRVDRIDYHPEHGYRILDYKAADRASTPKQTHRKRDADGHWQWVDLQLPLYAVLASSLDLPAGPALGYFNLPKERKEAGVSEAAWDQAMLEEAQETARWVVRQVRAQVFWPPAEPAKYSDPYQRICADRVMQRQTLIRAAIGEGRDTADDTPSGR
jgi:hypothetical protein